MAKKGNVMQKLLSFVAWLTGIIVSLAVGFALIGGDLYVPWIGIINVIAGWVVVITTILSVLLAIVHKLR